jgi:MFS family permease
MTVVIGRHTHSMGSVMAILTMGHSLGMMTGPILGGVMTDLFELELAFKGGTVVMLTGLVVALLLTAKSRALEEG